MNDHFDEEKGLSYTWKQTDQVADILLNLKGSSSERLKKFDATFTSRSANISLSEDENHVIHLHDEIIKERSKVEISKGNASIRMVKKRPGIWPCLEVSSKVRTQSMKDQSSVTAVGIMNGEHDRHAKASTNPAFVNKTTESIAGSEERDKDDNSVSPSLTTADSSEMNDEKDEKPVYHLDHLKHDFFEKGILLTLQVYVKCQNKDHVKIDFTRRGFALEFHTSDERFYKLHEGTSAETLFTWAVNTRGEISPEACTFKVKQSVIEVTLHKVCQERWPSLEASLRKENESSASSNMWLPLKTAATTSSIPASPSSILSSNSPQSEATTTAQINKSSVIPGDHLLDVDLKAKKRVNLAPGENFQSGGNSGLSAFSDNLRFRGNLFQDVNKPTAKVFPLTKQMEESAQVVSPGYAGLANFGNTCFMNCVIQVLANTRELRDFFLNGQFQEEINEDNPLGMKGHLAMTFGVLLRRLWSCTRQCWEPRKLKDLISKKNPQFFGFAQHDAHEFMAFLLDGLHEDLNRIRKKPYTETVDSDGRPDEVVAGEAWSQFKRRNDSVVVDLFQGQYKSKLICPKCGKVSITFDPFLYMSVPLPKKRKVIPVTFMWKEFYKKPHLYQIQVSQDSTVEELIDGLAQKTHVKATNIRVFEAYRGKIHKFFMTRSSLSHIEARDIIVACELLSEELAGEEVLEIPVIQRTLCPTDLPSRCGFCHKDGVSLKRCSKCFKVGYCDHTCQRNHWASHKPQCSTSPEPIGCPFILSVPASRATYGHLVKQMEGFARFSVNVFQPPVIPAEGVANPTPNPSSSSNPSPSPVPPSNLNSTLSQSCSSLNSLDSLSSASSTCTLTGDQSDPQMQDEAANDNTSGITNNNSDCDVFSARSPSAASLSSDTVSSEDSRGAAVKVSSVDSGIESSASGKSEKAVPTSQVLGMRAVEAERDRMTAPFFIKPVTMEGVGIRGAERLEDKGAKPLELSSHSFLSMDWRNKDRQPCCVLVQAKELEAKEVDDSNTINNNSSQPTLKQCLELFTEPEILRPEEAWYCPACKQHVEASKQMAIWQLPHTLIIQLKRFSFQNFLLRSKIKRHVDFPTKGLDLQQFCASTNLKGSPPPIYDLYGVVNHHGLLIGGHYTSYVRCAGKGSPGTDDVGWRLCDDSRVSSIGNEKSAVTPDAYLLFYRRRGAPAEIGSCSPSTFHSLDLPPPPRVIPTNQNVVDNDRDDHSSAFIPSTREEVEYNEAVISSARLEDGSASDTINSLRKLEMGMNKNDRKTNAAESHSSFPDWIELEAERNCGESYGSSPGEKGDREKEFYDCKESNEDRFYSDDDDDNDDSGYRKGNLVIDTGPDLGYTDMEAVD